MIPSRERTPWLRLSVTSVVTTVIAVAAPLVWVDHVAGGDRGDQTVLASAQHRESVQPPSTRVLRAFSRTPSRADRNVIALDRQRRALRRAAEAAALKLKRQREEAERVPTVFRVASFNVLGASHTTSRRGFSRGVVRMALAVDLLRARDIDVVGFQEFEDPQYSSFMGRTAGSFGVYPGRALGPKSIRFSIAWRLSDWTLVDASSVTVPYAGGSRIQMPYVLLRDNVSGQEVYFANFHNPADTPNLGHNARWRAIATGIEVALANQLAATGHPVVITGDMNDRVGYFCRMTTGAPMHAAIGGSSGVPCSPTNGLQVDWIFGSSQIAFSDYRTDRSAPIPRVTDHPIVFAQGTIAPPPAKTR
jgi:hypothetical protein